MDYFPIFVAVQKHKLLFVGGSLDIVHKVRLVLKSTADIHVFSPNPIDDDAGALSDWHQDGRITLHHRDLTQDDCINTAFAFIDGDDQTTRDHARKIFDQENILYAVIDDQKRSRFITPALIDRDPIVVAIGTEGTGPVLARRIKAQIEQLLHPSIGLVAEVAGRFRPKVETLPKGNIRRQFWSDFFDKIVPNVLNTDAADMKTILTNQLLGLLKTHRLSKPSSNPKTQHTIARIAIASADADLLTRGALNLIHDADLVVHDDGVPQTVLELTRRESIKLTASSCVDRDLVDKIKDHYEKGMKIICLENHISPLLYPSLAPNNAPKKDDQFSILQALMTKADLPIRDATGYLLPPDPRPASSLSHPYRLKVAS